MFGIRKYVDFCFHKENFIGLIALILSVLAIYFFNIQVIYENSILENIQLIALFVAFVFCFKVKNHKVFFHFLAFIMFLMFMREISYGRAIFAQIPGTNGHDCYTWKEIKYGYLAHYIVGLYMASALLYGLVNKVWVDIIDMVKNIKMPFWTFFGSVGCVFLQIISEKTLHDTRVEETAELVLYCLILALIIIYRKK